MTPLHKPPGQVPGPLLVLGSVALVLGFAVDLMGVFRVPTENLLQMWQAAGVKVERSVGITNPLGILAGAAVSYAMVGAILGTPGEGRRAILGFSVFLLSLLLVPVLGVWGIFWKPFGFCLMVLWAWVSAAVYAHGHRMPCEGVEEDPAENIISITGNLDLGTGRGTAEG